MNGLEVEFLEELPFVMNTYKESDLLSFLESCRKEKKLSYAGIGRILGCNRSMARKLFCGKIKLGIDRALNLLHYFDYGLSITKLEYNEFMSEEEIEISQKCLDAELDIESRPDLYKELNK